MAPPGDPRYDPAVSATSPAWSAVSHHSRLGIDVLAPLGRRPGVVALFENPLEPTAADPGPRTKRPVPQPARLPAGSARLRAEARPVADVCLAPRGNARPVEPTYFIRRFTGTPAGGRSRGHFLMTFHEIRRHRSQVARNREIFKLSQFRRAERNWVAVHLSRHFPDCRGPARNWSQSGSRPRDRPGGALGGRGPGRAGRIDPCLSVHRSGLDAGPGACGGGCDGDRRAALTCRGDLPRVRNPSRAGSAARPAGLRGLSLMNAGSVDFVENPAKRLALTGCARKTSRPEPGRRKRCPPRCSPDFDPPNSRLSRILAETMAGNLPAVFLTRRAPVIFELNSCRDVVSGHRCRRKYPCRRRAGCQVSGRRTCTPKTLLAALILVKNFDLLSQRLRQSGDDHVFVGN